MKTRIKFRKYGVMRFIGHLDVMRYFQKAMRRADIPIAFTSGYSPHMIMSFAQPLGIGITSDGEYLDIELTKAVASDEAVRRLNQVMVEGIDVVSFVQISEDKKDSGMTIVAAAAYEISLLRSSKSMYETLPVPEEWSTGLTAFLGQDNLTVLKKTKRSEREVNIRPMIYQMEITDSRIRMFLAAGSEENLKPDLVMDTFLKNMGFEPEKHPYHVHRLDLYAKTPEGRYLPLEALGDIIAGSSEMM